MIFRLLIFVSFFTAGKYGFCETKNTVAHADSLFDSKKYTEAFETYQSIYSEGLASPAMLAKMAFIKEGLGNYTEALFYLDHYYKKTSNKKVLQKMYELADQNDLSGYEFSDYKFFVNNINKHNLYIILTLLFLTAAVVSIMYGKRVRGSRAAPWAVLQLLIIIPALLILNSYFSEKEAIIMKDQTVLMEGPSAGSEPLDLLDKGHKVKVLEIEPVWSKIQIGETKAYVRSNRIKNLL